MRASCLILAQHQPGKFRVRAFPNAKVIIDDLRGDGDHYAAKIIAEEFRGKTRVQQHQMVYNAMGGRMGKELHALALNTSAPKE